MKELTAVVSRKGQVTIPAEIRQLLGLKQGDKVAFLRVGDRVHLVRAGGIVEMTAGILQGRGPVLTARELRRAAEEAIAEVAEERSGR